ncbi:unnamed protein product [Closterium sp. Yama58-4]|nr:unnamed protein product [Closterium sp. Yama58-4]
MTSRCPFTVSSRTPLPLPPPLSPLFPAPGPCPVDPLPPQGPAPSGVPHVVPLPLAEPFKPNAVDSGAAGGGAYRGAESVGADPEGAELGGAEPEGVEPGGAEPEGAELGGVLRLLEVLRVPRHSDFVGESLSHHSSCASGLLGAATFGLAPPELEALPLEALTLEALVLEALDLVVLELEALELEALELEVLELEALEQEALELETLELEALELEALELEALELETLELVALELEALELEALELETQELEHSHYDTSSFLFSTAYPPPSPPASCFPDVPDPESDLVCAASPTVTRLLATIVTDPSFESIAMCALVVELVDFAAACRLDYAANLVAESQSVYPLSIKGECALGTDVLEDKQEDFESLAAAVPHLVAMLLAPEGDPDALDIPTLRSYSEAIMGPYSSQWQTAMDAEMASWKSTSTYVDAVPPPGANIVDGMWIFRVKRLPGSPPVFKARYVARGFSQRQGVYFFQTFSPTPKMTTLWVLLHVAAHRDYELHSLDFSTAFLHCLTLLVL